MKTLRFGLAVISFIVLSCATLYAQTASTGMIQGEIKDPSGAAVPSAAVRLVQTAANAVRTVTSDSSGRYGFPLLSPGRYDLEVTAPGFAAVKETAILVQIEEKTVLDVNLKLATTATSITVRARPDLVQSATSVLGRVVDAQQVENLPLATRNYTQILGLSPGVLSNISNAGALGANTTEVSAEGSRLSDNNVQVNGADANNVFTTNLSGGGGGQGVAIPAPDTIQEFKVQTALYDASTGRNGGANIDVVTKSGTNSFHGDVYEYFRNDALNANDFFLNRANQPRPRLRQNMYGFTLGGPIVRNKLLFFISYQGNRQTNGVTGGSISSVFLPPLTGDRSAASLGKIFGGQKGQFGGVAIAADGSNINPVALAILNAKLPNGQFVVPTPQTLLPSGVGQSIFSSPADYTEHQFNSNFDVHFSANDILSEKYFYSRNDSTIPFGGGASVPGFPSVDDGQNHNATLTWFHIFNPRWLNQARFAFTRLHDLSDSIEPISAQSVGMTTPVTVTGLPNIGFLTSNLQVGASLAPSGSAVNNFQWSDSVTVTHGRHLLHFGGEIKRTQANVLFRFDQRAALRFFTFPDFLLGLSYPANGASVPFSDVFISSARAGLINRGQRLTDGNGFFQDDLSVNPKLKVNLGIRYELYGSVSDALGRLANFDISRALPNPPTTGTLAGFVIANNTVGGDPNGVVRLDGNTVISPDRDNWGPRFGFAYRPLTNNANLVFRGGYGVYYSRPGTVIDFQSGPNLPFAVISTLSGAANRGSTLQNPFNPNLPSPQAFPVYLPITPTSAIFVSSFDPNLRAPMVQQWGLDMQYGFGSSFVLDVGYVGTHGTGLLGSYRFNQPLLASPTNPVHGVTTNSLANVNQRAPILGIDPSTSLFYTNAFGSVFHALQASVSRRFSHGLQFMAAYTWSHDVDNLPSGSLQAVGVFQGDVRDFAAERASSDFDRRQRFVLNYYWELPQRATGNAALKLLLNGWSFTGIGTFQTGLPFSVVDTSAATIYGTTPSFAQLVPGASVGTVQLGGSTESRLNRYFNTAGFVAAPTIGNGKGFGNSPRNMLRGPGQRSVDLAVIKRFRVGHPTEVANIEYRAEFFNAFNFVNFGMPANNFASPQTFGVINSTTVAPRIIQMALKFNF